MFKGIFEQAQRPPYGFPAIKEVEGYWQALHDKARIPNRADIDPRGIKSALPNAFLLSVNSSSEWRFRLVGSNICSLRQEDLRGHQLTDIFAPGRRVAMDDVLKGVLNLPARAKVTFSVAKRGVDHIAQMVLLPLRDTELGGLQILGCLDFDPTLLRSKAMLDLEPTGSFIRPLSRSIDVQTRRFCHPKIKLVSENKAPAAQSGRNPSPALRLITP